MKHLGTVVTGELLHDFNLLEHLIVPIEVTLYFGFFNGLDSKLLIRVAVLYESHLTERALSEETDGFICIDARVKEALALKNLSMPVLQSLIAVEVDGSLLSCLGAHYCKAEFTINRN